MREKCTCMGKRMRRLSLHWHSRNVHVSRIHSLAHSPSPSDFIDQCIEISASHFLNACCLLIAHLIMTLFILVEHQMLCYEALNDKRHVAFLHSHKSQSNIMLFFAHFHWDQFHRLYIPCSNCVFVSCLIWNESNTRMKN